MSHRSVVDKRLAHVLVLLALLVLGACGNKAGRRPFAELSEGTGGETGQGGAGGGPVDFVCEGVQCPDGLTCESRGDDAACVCDGEDCSEVGCFTAPCAEFATCTDLEEGSYQCACHEGFSGNGFECSAGDPCEDVECPGENTACRVNATGGFCVCDEGYQPVSGSDSCVDIDECAEDASLCGAEGHCHNYPGGFLCDCDPGFEEDEGSCVDIDECSVGIDSCDEARGACTNVTAGFGCACETGEGDGRLCKATADCEPDTCKSGGMCIETPTGTACRCPIGFTGPTCEDATTCAVDVVLNGAVDPVIVDPVVREAVEQAVGVMPGASVTVGDLQSLYSLYVLTPIGDGPVATSLEGLQCWPTLSTLSLSHHGVSDLSPLADMAALVDLDLTCNPVTDLSPLDGHMLLTSLSLEQSDLCEAGAQVTDLSPLNGLLGLKTLSLQGQGVSDLSVLAGLKQIQVLNVSANPITSLSSLSGLGLLQDLYAWETDLTDLSELGELPSLRTVNLSSSSLNSLAGVSSAVGLRELNLTDNALKDLDGLEGLPYLQTILARDNLISDPAALAALPWLVQTNLQDNELESLEDFVNEKSWGAQGQLVVVDNPMSCTDEADNIAELESRGLSVASDCSQ